MELIPTVQWRLDADFDLLYRECRRVGIPTSHIDLLEPLDEFDERRVGRICFGRDKRDAPLERFLPLIRAIGGPDDSDSGRCMIHVAIAGHKAGCGDAVSTWASVGDLYGEKELGADSQNVAVARVMENTVSAELAARLRTIAETAMGQIIEGQ